MSVYQVGPACYSTAKAAASAWASSANFTPISIGTNCNAVMRYEVTGTDAAPVVSTQWTRVVGTCTVPASVNITASWQPCNLWSVQDGFQAAWIVAGAWIVAKAVVYLRRAFK